MAEELSKEKKKSNGRNSFSRRTSLDGRQSILPHFRQSFASFKVLGSNPRRYSISNGKPTSPVASLNSTSDSRKSPEKPKSSKNAGSSSRRIIYPHFRTSFATFNVGGGVSRIKSTRKLSSSSNEGDVHHQTSLDTHYDANSKKNSINETKPTSSSLQSSSSLDIHQGGNSTNNPITERKPTSSSLQSSSSLDIHQGGNSTNNPINETSLDIHHGENSKKNPVTERKLEPSSSGLRSSFLPHYRSSFIAWSAGANSRISSAGKQTSTLKDKEINTNPRLHLRASNDAWHVSCKHGLQDENEEKPRDEKINANPCLHLRASNDASHDSCEHGLQYGNEEKPRDKEINTNPHLYLSASNDACENGLQDGKEEKPKDKKINANPRLHLRSSNDASHDSCEHGLQYGNEEKPRDKEINTNPHLYLSASNDACENGLQDGKEEKPKDKKNNANSRLHLRSSNDAIHDSCEHGLQDGNEEKPRDKEINTNPHLYLSDSNDACEHGLQDGKEEKPKDKKFNANPHLYLSASNDACEHGLEDGNEEKPRDKEITTNPHLHLRASNDACHNSCIHGLQDGNEEKSRIAERNEPPMSLKYDHNGGVIGQDKKTKNGTSTPNYSSDSEILSSKQELLISSKMSSSVGSRLVMEEPYASLEVSESLNTKGNNSKLETMTSPKSQNLRRSKSLEHDSPRHHQMIKQKSDDVQTKPNQTIDSFIEAKNENQSEILIESPPPPLTISDSSSPHSNLPVSLSDDESSEFEYTEEENDYYESEYTDEETSSETDEIIMDDNEGRHVEGTNVEGTNVKNGEGETDKRRTRNKVVHYVGEDSIPVKLKFRRGRIIEIEKNDENGPKRLRFRRGRILESNEVEVNGLKRRIYRRRVERIPKLKTSPKAEKVELKHQEMEEKKDLQVLLNDVIEETASKLVEERKSKVKALVGAFETVITTIESVPVPVTPAATV